MRNIRSTVLLASSVAIGLFAVAIGQSWIVKRAEVATKSVVVASKDLPFGTQLKEGMLEVVEWPAKSDLPQAHADPVQIYQRVINTAILKGEPVLAAKLAPQGEKSGLSALLHEGSRAITVKVNEIVGVAGFALPGNHVDVIVNATHKSGHVVSKIVLERILVLALAQDASTSETKPRLVNAVTLEVTPVQAEQIDLARSVGSLSLVLRSQMDTAHVQTPGASIVSLFGNPEPVAPAPPLVTSKPTVTPPAATRPREPMPAKPPPQPKPEIIRGITKSLE